MTFVLIPLAIITSAGEVRDRTALTPAEVDAEIRRLTGLPNPVEREGAARRLGHYCKAFAALAALPTLERAAAKEPVWEARGEALRAAARVAVAHGRPCPRVVLDALWDDDMRDHAAFALGELRRLDPAAVREVVRLTTAPKPADRSNGMILLGAHAASIPQAEKLLRAATADPDREVRHNAHAMLFRVTGDLCGLFRYVMRLRAECAVLLDLPPDATDPQKAERVQLNLMLLGTAGTLAEWTQNRPKDMLAVILAATRDDSPPVRLETVRLVGRYAEALAEPPAADPAYRSPAHVWYDPKKQREGMTRIVSADGLRDRLKELSAADADAKVRTEAGRVLERVDAARRK